MFTIHLTQLQTCSAAPSCRKDGSSCSLHQSTEPRHQSLRRSRLAHELQQSSTTPSSSSLSAGHSSLVSRLQSSMFFGGFGALSREIEGLHKGFSEVESNSSAPAALVPVTVVAAADTALGAQAAKEGATHKAETSSPEAHQSSGSAMVIVPRLMSSQASGTAAAERPRQWYRVTIEEISKGDWEKEAEDGVELALPTVSTTTTRTTTTTTQSVMLPAGMVETLLRGVTAGGAEAGTGGVAILSASSEQVRVDGKVEAKGLKSEQQQQQQQQQQQHEECDRQGTVEPTTQFLNPIRHDATACSVANQKAVTEAATDTTAVTGSSPVRVNNDANTVPVLVSKVKELSPSSWSSSTSSRRDPKLLVAANGDETVQVATQRTMTGLKHSQEKEEERERDLRPWWQRRREAQSAQHPRSLEDKSLRRGKGSNGGDGDDDGDGIDESADRVRRRPWPPRRDALRNGETVTQSTVIGPDGTVQSRTVMVTTTRTKRDAEMHHAETNIHSRDIQQQQQQQQQESAAHHEPMGTELQPQESQKLQQGEQHRSKLRERWAQRHHRQQAHQDLWTQNEGLDERDERHTLWERRRQQRERLRELREAEAQQREATAAAYGFNIHPPTLGNNGGWPVRERNAGAAAAAQEEEAGRVADGRTSAPRRTWPPKGYLRRQELERDEPRHNV